MSKPTLISPYGYDASTCGYCTPSGSRSAGATSKKYAFEGSQMSVKFYQDIIDRGWRRSGNFVYHPDMARTCCPQYTIRLDAREFKPNKKHRQVMNRWNRYLSTGSREAGEPSKKGKGKAKADGMEEDWIHDLHRHDASMFDGAEGIKFETTLTPATATEETFDLYKRYQVAVHKDKPDKVSMPGFRRFLCQSPLIEELVPYKGGYDRDQSKMRMLPEKYGSYHLLYRVDSKLVGFSVIDILPRCVSSVYFIWDPDWAWASLGKLSAMVEASLAKRMYEAGAGGGWLYMGYWIANCQKMRYKSEYSPSFLLDPGTNTFHPLTAQLDDYLRTHSGGNHPFASVLGANDADKLPLKGGDKSPVAADAGMSTEGTDSDDDLLDILSFPSPPPPGCAPPDSFSAEAIGRTMVLYGGQVKGRLLKFSFNNPEVAQRKVRELYAALGQDLIAVAGKGLAGVKDRGILLFG